MTTCPAGRIDTETASPHKIMMADGTQNSRIRSYLVVVKNDISNRSFFTDSKFEEGQYSRNTEGF